MSNQKKICCFKLSLEDWDFLTKLAASRRLNDVSSLIRQLIEEAKLDEIRVEEEIRFHEYHLGLSKLRLEEIKKHKAPEIKPEEKKSEETVVRKESNRIVHLILTSFEGFQKNDVKKIEENKEKIIEMVKKEISKIDEKELEMVKQKVQKSLARWNIQI